MKHLLFLLALLTTIDSISQNKTTLKGKVNNWPTDSIYVQTMPYYSPHSAKLKSLKLEKDNSFSVDFHTEENTPIVVQLFLTPKALNTVSENLLFANYSEKYYYGYCDKFYTYGTAVFLLEPNETLDVTLTNNEVLKKLNPKKAEKYRNLGVAVNEDDTINNIKRMTIEFNSINKFQQNYYQASFSIDDVIDDRLGLYKNKSIAEAVVGYSKIKTKLLADLEAVKNKMSPYFYNYLKAEIEFGARKEFLRFLMLTKEKEANDFFGKPIPKEVLEVIEFDKNKITPTILASEEYNKFLMLYLNFKLNVQYKKYNRNYIFGVQKIKKAIKTFPEKSVYYFVANNLLLTNREALIANIKSEKDVERLIISTISRFSNGELNDKLMEKYNL